MNRYQPTWLVLALAIAMAGCSVEKPADTSDPEASAKWIAHCQKKAGKAKTPATEIQWLEEWLGHAEEAGRIGTLEIDIPPRVLELSMKSEDLEAFEWALAHGARLNADYHALAALYRLGSGWQDRVLSVQPDALPVFMYLAAEKYDTKLFSKHADAFKATGYKVRSPLESNEFNVRYCRFVAEQLDDALKENDRQQIEFLVDHLPARNSVAVIDKRTGDIMRALGDSVFQALENEALACKLVGLGYEYNRIDLTTPPFGAAFADALRTNPDYAIRTLKLDEWIGALSEAETTFLLTLPDEAWHSLHKLHVDEAIETCMKNGNSTGALRFISLRANRNPLNGGDYAELMNWALQYGSKAVFDYVMNHNEEMDLFSIDFALLARNQTLFETFAPQIMDKVYRSMDTHPRSDGTTFGRIRQVFGSPNEAAGLYLVQKYNLSEAWTRATEGRTLLMDVCHAGNLDAARFLVERRGEDIAAETGYSELEISIFGSNRPTEGKLSPIFFAAKSGNSELINYLKSKGADVNARSNYGTTPLMHAVTAGHLEATKTLIALRANVNAEMDSRINQTDLRQIGSYDEISNAYRRARTNGHGEILEALEQAGARP